jgi:hypothetical protein
MQDNVLIGSKVLNAQSGVADCGTSGANCLLTVGQRVGTSDPKFVGVITHFRLYPSKAIAVHPDYASLTTSSTTTLPPTTTTASSDSFFNMLSPDNHDQSISAQQDGSYSFDGASALVLKNYESIASSFSVYLRFKQTARNVGALFSKANHLSVRYFNLVSRSTNGVAFVYKVRTKVKDV